MTPEPIYDDTHDENRPIKAHELQLVLEETEVMLQEMRDVINVHAEVLASHRWVLEKFVPAPLLADAFKQYYESRKKQIEVESAIDEPSAKEIN